MKTEAEKLIDSMLTEIPSSKGSAAIRGLYEDLTAVYMKLKSAKGLSDSSEQALAKKVAKQIEGPWVDFQSSIMDLGK